MKRFLASSFTLIFCISAYSQTLDNLADNGVNVENSSTGTGYFQWINLRLAGNTLSSQNTNGNILLLPNGTGQILIPDGSLAAPGMAFDSDNDTGIRYSGGFMRFVNAGNDKFLIGPTDIRFNANYAAIGGGTILSATGVIGDYLKAPVSLGATPASDDLVMVFDASNNADD